MILHKLKWPGVLLCAAISMTTAVADVEKPVSEWPIFDAHIHYSHDVWEAIPPADAIRRLREAGVKRALVSSSSDEGTQRLYQADPEFVVPSLRPYRKRGTLDSWMHDETLIPYLQQRLQTFKYAAIGEFHIDGEEAKTPVMREVIRLARQYDLILHVHSDAEAVRLIFEQYPQARILWAHAGFEQAAVVEKFMDKYPNLMADLSFRYEVYQNGHFFPGWEQLLLKHADRFLLGIDTYEPQRWLQVKNAMLWQRELLAALPGDVAKKLAWGNSEWITRRFDQQKRAQATGELVTAVSVTPPVVVFPEGTFTRVPGLRYFHMGAFQAAAGAGVLVLPVAIRGTRSILRAKSKIPYRGAITVTVGEAIDLAVDKTADKDPWKTALELRNAARQHILRHCGEPELKEEMETLQALKQRIEGQDR